LPTHVVSVKSTISLKKGLDKFMFWHIKNTFVYVIIIKLLRQLAASHTEKVLCM